MRLEIIQLFYENILKARRGDCDQINNNKPTFFILWRAAVIIKIKIFKEHFIGNVSWGFEYLIDLV